ncbi:hypothetical protein V490_02012 [Pseudogymnoascus sp. VKM F-3557]|nr:hypothetical protein V490_02012 [Pseudogymnoascus sp. VKM F-3557]
MRGTAVLCGLAGLALCNAETITDAACEASFETVTAAAAVKDLNPGWNLGNTLDAIPDETSWGNSAQEATFDDIKASGFKSIRIPVTWADHITTQSPNWTIDTAWMDRVEEVVDWAITRDLWVVLNVHHDSWEWADVTQAGADLAMIEEKFSALWAQIGDRFKCKSSKLILEPINEFPGDTQEHGDELNKLQDMFLDEINKAGGYNPQRVVSLGGLGQDSIKTSQFFERGTTYPDQPWALQFHYYSPYDFIFGAWGKTIWGSDDDKAAVEADFANLRGNFTDVPIFIGEWEASGNVESAARWKYFDFLIRTANANDFSTILWDNGAHFNRPTGKWVDPSEPELVIAAAAGTSNSLADSTVDITATEQESSAYVFHKVGDAVAAQTVSYALNGNTIKSITNSAGTALAATDYTVADGVVTFTAEYLGSLYTATDAAGTKETLTVAFSAGASLSVTIVLWDTPTVATNSFKVDPSTDLNIPVTWNGLHRVAAVKARKADGTYLSDEWTEYLPPLQQGYFTFGSWGWDDENIIVYAAGLSTIQAAGQDVTLTFESFPRIMGENAVNITITQ